MKSRILVFIQFFVIFLMLLPVLMARTQYVGIGLLLIVLGLLVGWSALQKNPLGNFNIRPDIKEECNLITEGIYAYIRHPMYASVLLSMLGVTFVYFSVYELVLFFILLVNMVTKMLYEESLWHCEGEAYKEYAKRTKRLIPFVF